MFLNSYRNQSQTAPVYLSALKDIDESNEMFVNMPARRDSENDLPPCSCNVCKRAAGKPKRERFSRAKKKSLSPELPVMTFEEREQFKLQSRLRRLPKRKNNDKAGNMKPFERSWRRGVGPRNSGSGVPKLGSKEGTSLTNLFEKSSQIRRVKKGNHVEDYFEKIDQDRVLPPAFEEQSGTGRRNTDNLDRYFEGERKK